MKISLRGGKPSDFGKWLRANWAPVLVLCFLFLLALFVRSYFAYGLSQDNGYLVSGGSDSYYWRRIIDYNVETGDQLYWDPLINFPDGIRNPRPPEYSFSVAVPAVFAQALFPSLSDSVGFMFVWSTAFWGALTVIPVYLLGKETFGRRAGLVAAFFMAVMPSHVQRSVLSNADHDAFILFFIVLTFYFLLKAVKLQEHRKFIDSWKSLASIKAGLASYFATSRRAVLYSLMGGMAFGCVIMAWVGFAYVAVLILAYYIIQVLVNRFKNVDSTGVTMIVLISLGFGYLLSFPVYYEQSLISVRFDIPVYLFLAALIFGFMFLVSRDYPWTLTLPAIGALFAFGIIVIDMVDPALAEAIISGQGYFVQNKLYSTIAEARAPQFSELALSFGIVSFFLSLAGLLWALFKIPKRATAEYIFIVVWLAASIFMAISAGRFMFNAAPAFAIAAGWVTVIIVDALDLGTLRRNLSLASGSIFQVIRKNVKIRHVVGVLFLAFFLVLPNVWYSVDAGIPAETKADYDLQVYESLPSFMRAGDYDAINGTNWYFGAFGYSLPLPSYYFPAAWSWFSEQDQETYPETSRPGYVAWWDYGFEAVQEGNHPTLADNFQNGYQVAGNVIMAQTEQDAVALFTYKLIESGLKDGASVESALITTIEDHGVSYTEFHDIMTMPADEVVAKVLADQDLYGPMAEDMGAENARIVAARTLLASVGDDALTSLYSSVCEITGYEFRYFNVDSRMFPLSGTSTGIFYAPAKLSDRRIDTENGNIPYDFFTVKAVDTSGAVYELDEIPADAQIYTYTIEYQSMFYDSMFYRAMCGFSATDIGLEDDGTLPGAASGALSGYTPMPGWNMTHFRVVYRTAYYNPYPSDEVSDHRDAWRAVSYDEAQSLKARINAGEITGVVDDSDSYYSGGTVFLKYYHGAYLNGTITTEAGNAAAGIHVTVQDEYGIPHGSVTTDSEGRYSLLAPFGNLSLVISSGDLVDSPTLQGSNLITRLKVNVTDDQSMRVKQDLDNDGVWDYIITRDYVMADSEVYGEVFWDVGGDGNYTVNTDEHITDVTLTFTELTTGVTYDADASEGSYSMNLPPGKYSVFASLLGSGTVLSDQTNVSANAHFELSMPIEPANMTGALRTLDNAAVAGMEVVLTDVSTGYQFTTVTAEDGSYYFEYLMPSKYQITITSEDQMVFAQYISLDAGIEGSRNATVYDISHLRYKASYDGMSAAYAAYRVSDAYDPESSVSASADAYGWIDLALPAGEWTLYASFSDGTGVMAGAVGLTTYSGQTTSGTVYLEEAYEVSGTLKSPRSTTVRNIFMFFQDQAGTLIPVETTSKGEFRAMLPAGTYEVTAESIISQGQYSETMVVSGDMTGLLLRMDDGVTVEGYLWLDRDSSGSLEPAEIGIGIGMMFTYEDGRSVVLTTYTDGSFAASVPTGDTVTVTVDADGYSGWSYSGAWGDDASIGSLVATPDMVTVAGRLTCDGEGVRGVTISFLPIQFVADAFTVVTGADGWFSVQVAPSDYTIEVDQDVSPMGGERYQYSADVTIRPTSQTFELDVDAVKRVEMEGTVLGATSDIQVSIVGPESHDLTLDGYTYSVYVIPGRYDIYATGLTGEQTYAGMLSAEVTADTRVFDVTLEVASTVQGRATLTTGIVNKAVTVSAVSSSGALATVESTATGSYSIDLAQDTYTISFLLEGTSTLGTQTVYVEHFHEESVVVGTGDLTLNPVLAERLDNTTLSGTVSGLDGSPAQATVYLTATGKYGLDLTFSTSAEGEFSASVQPGEYTMYVVRGQDRGVQLTYLTVERNTPAEADIQLEAGRYLYGSVEVAGLPASEEVSVALDDAYMTAVSGSDGRFSLLLPSGEYILSSSATRTEAGMTVSYGLSKTVTVGTYDAYAAMTLVRDTERSVKLSWDEARQVSAAPGETVNYAFTVENTGNVEDTYTFSVTTKNAAAVFTPSTVTVDFGTNGKTATVVAAVTVGEVEAGEVEVTVQARSKTLTSVKGTVTMTVEVLPGHGANVTSLGTGLAVSSSEAYADFRVNSTGNVVDKFMVSIVNLETLEELGWTAEILDAETNESVEQIELEAYASKELRVQFTATRADANPEAAATVYAYPVGYESTGAYASVQVVLPDLTVSPGDIDAARDDISYEADTESLYIDIALLATLAALVVMFFVLRRRKGLGGKGGEKA